MTQEDTCKPRFKGIENFLRRIAFNLGNSPSQTEVKIISCIPIDVTDLQQKILILEKELSDAKKQKNTTKHKNKYDCNRFGSERKTMYDSSTANRSIAISNQCNNSSLDYTVDRNLSNISFEFSSHSKPLIEAIYERAVSEQSIKSKWDKQKFIANRCVKNIFRKRKKKNQEQKRGQTQFVYYAQTDYGPKFPNNKLSYSYLYDVFRKHYDPKLVLRECSDTSHFSAPICRDLSHSCKKLSPFESEVCSCCHGRFQNVDIYMNDIGNNAAPVLKPKTMKNSNKKASLFDLLPAKDNTAKNKPNFQNEYRKIKKYYNVSNVNCWQEHDDTKHRPYGDQRKKNIKLKVSQHKEYNDWTAEHSTPNKTGHRKASIIYKNECIPVTKPHREDTNRLKNNISSSQIKTAIYDCTKTEAVLNEIKRMLRSVLTEIKTNTEMRHIKDCKRKNDATIQNGPSRNDMQRSTFLHSFMYNNSNYCTNPYLLPYTGQLPLTQYCFSNMPFQPLKYPPTVVPQTYTLRPKKAVTRSTNTSNVEKETNMETGKLIKEIYKSVNSNVENQSNDESCNIIQQRSTSNSSISNANTNFKDGSIKLYTKKDAQVEAQLSSITTYTASKVVYTAITSKSGHNTKENVVHRFTETDVISEEDEPSDTETISTSSVTKSVKDTNKAGVLTKMFSVFKKKRSNRDEETEMSETDDYETVYTAYTNKANNTPKIKRPAAGISIRVPASRNRKKQKTGEECRRQWIEDLLNEESGYYAPKGKTQSFKSYSKPVYGQDYEARPVFVVPKRNYTTPYRRNENANKMCKLTIGRNKTSYLKNAKLMRCGRNWKKFILES